MINVSEWANLLVRWVHVFSAILWVGSTYYFTWLDGQMRRGADRPVWMVHSGGFYTVVKQKTLGVPPGEVHWFRYEALATFISGFLLLNLVFATLFVMFGPDDLLGPGAAMLGGRWSQSFFFSIQTFATIGYGQVGPNGLAANLIVTVEALVGMMYQALATGLLFVRFARPRAEIMFSDVAVIAPYNDGLSLQLRLANVRRNEIIALTGTSGHTTGPHIHYEVRVAGTAVNPYRYLRTSAPKTEVASTGKTTHNDLGL